MTNNMIIVTDEIVNAICPTTLFYITKFNESQEVIEMFIKPTDEYVGKLYVRTKDGMSNIYILPEECDSVMMWLREQKLNSIL